MCEYGVVGFDYMCDVLKLYISTWFPLSVSYVLLYRNLYEACILDDWSRPQAMIC